MTPRRAVLGTPVAAVGALVLLPSLAPATVEEQHARLPLPAECQDPAEGIWMSHKYETEWDERMIFTLHIRRDPRGAQVTAAQGDPRRAALVGNSEAHAWLGAGPQSSAPPVCTPGLHHWTVAMTAEGFARENHIEYWGTRWAVQNVFCGPRSFGDNPDHFTGTIDPAIQEFQSVNNDGGRAVNDPTVFRRVRCFEPVSPPHPYVAPPAFRPPARSGCARR